MIESLMLIALGFFIATLLAAITMQFVWRRAVTVTKRAMAEDGQEAEESARAYELDTLIRRQQDETAPLQVEIERLHAELDHLRSEKQQLAALQQSLAHENGGLREECDRLTVELDNAHQQMEARQEEITAQAAERASRLAALKQELARLEEVISGEESAEDMQSLEESISGENPSDDTRTETDARTLAELKETLARIDTMSKAGNITLPAHQAPEESLEESPEENKEEAVPEAPLGDKALIARIRALEAGVAS